MAAGGDAAAAAAPKSSAPEKEDNLTYALAHLAAFDIAPLHPKADLVAQTRDNVQFLVNKVFGLKREDTEEGAVVIIPPEEGFRLPRCRPIPKVKPETRWDKFMKERRMEKRKRSRMIFDETSGDWKPRYGFKSAKQNEDRAQGIMEVKTGHDSMANPFDKKKAEGKLIAAKQKMREVRNRVEAAGSRLSAAAPNLDVGMRAGGDAAKRGAAGLKEALRRAQTSSASAGKFDRAAPNEAANLQRKKQKVTQFRTLGEEKERYLKTADQVFKGEGPIDKDKMVAAGRRMEGDIKVKRKEKAPKRRSKQGGRKSSSGKSKR